MIVIDSSALLPGLLDRQRSHGALLREVLQRDDDLNAPHLLDLEMIQALRRLVRRAEITSEQAVAALDGLASLPLERYPHEAFIGRIWELRDSLSAYDAAYVALAEILGARLLTADRRLAAAPGVNCVVEVVGG
jgi:predicted nucleic acid-binding protein